MRRLRLRRQNGHAIGKFASKLVGAGSRRFRQFRGSAGGASFRHALYMTFPISEGKILLPGHGKKRRSERASLIRLQATAEK